MFFFGVLDVGCTLALRLIIRLVLIILSLLPASMSSFSLFSLPFLIIFYQIRQGSLAFSSYLHKHS